MSMRNMSVDSKYAYRFGYLKSEKWKAVRLEALVRESGKCQICGEESISNDAHHAWYPDSIWDTTERQLVVLCRPCHDFIHTMVPECKTSNEQDGREMWLKFSNAIIAWRRDKIALFGSTSGIKIVNPRFLREELEKVKTELELYRESNQAKSRSGEILLEIKRLVDSYADSANSVISPVASSDKEI